MKQFTLGSLIALLIALSATTAPDALAQRPSERQLIDGWYRQYLGRRADPVGMRGWLGVLRDGYDLTHVEASILGSDEYYERNGYSAHGFVRGLYRDVLRRRPAPGEVQQWAEEVDYGADRAQVARQFIESARPGFGPRR